MSSDTIARFRVGHDDGSGNRIESIYARNAPDYLVYRSKLRVMVRFADDRKRALRQRSAIAILSPLRGQISGLIDGWHSSKKPANKSRAERYDRRVADALTVGLEGGVADALALLTEIRDDIVAERRSLAQTDYLLWASAWALLLILVLSIVSAQWFASVRAFPAFAHTLWTGAAGGTIGAFFSVATGMRRRTVLVDLQQWDNRRDAILRIAIGTLGGAVLVSLLLTGIVKVTGIELSVGAESDKIPPAVTLLKALVVGFIAGFSERAVPDLLEKASLATDAKVAGTTDVAGDQAKAAAAGGVPPLVPTDGAADEPAAEGEAAVDACLSDVAPVEGERLTQDRDLPVAVGGVSGSSPPPPFDPAATSTATQAAKPEGSGGAATSGSGAVTAAAATPAVAPAASKQADAPAADEEADARVESNSDNPNEE